MNEKNFFLAKAMAAKGESSRSLRSWSELSSTHVAV